MHKSWQCTVLNPGSVDRITRNSFRNFRVVFPGRSCGHNRDDRPVVAKLAELNDPVIEGRQFDPKMVSKLPAPRWRLAFECPLLIH